MFLLLMGLVLIIVRFVSLFPGWRAVSTVFDGRRCYVRLASDDDGDIEIGQQKSKAFWAEAARALRGAHHAPQPQPVAAPVADVQLVAMQAPGGAPCDHNESLQVASHPWRFTRERSELDARAWGLKRGVT